MFSNQRCQRSEPLEKQKAARMTNGAVGMMGRKMPITPSTKQMNPAATYRDFIGDSTKDSLIDFKVFIVNVVASFI